MFYPENRALCIFFMDIYMHLLIMWIFYEEQKNYYEQWYMFFLTHRSDDKKKDILAYCAFSWGGHCMINP